MIVHHCIISHLSKNPQAVTKEEEVVDVSAEELLAAKVTQYSKGYLNSPNLSCTEFFKLARSEQSTKLGFFA